MHKMEQVARSHSKSDLLAQHEPHGFSAFKQVFSFKTLNGNVCGIHSRCAKIVFLHYDIENRF